MAAEFTSGAAANTGDNYTPVEDLVVWVQAGDLLANSAETFTSPTIDGDAMNLRSWEITDITGGADPIGGLMDLADPTQSSSALSVSVSPPMARPVGYALSIAGADTSDLIASEGSEVYASDNSPKLTIDAPANSCIVYWKHHASSASPTFTAPAGFTQRYTLETINSPAFRNFVLYTRDVTTALTSFDLGADTTTTSFGGIHGYAIYNEAPAGGACCHNRCFFG